MKIMSQKQMAYFAECYDAIDVKHDSDAIIATFKNMTEVVDFLRTRQLNSFFCAQFESPVPNNPYEPVSVRIYPAIGVDWGMPL